MPHKLVIPKDFATKQTLVSVSLDILALNARHSKMDIVIHTPCQMEEELKVFKFLFSPFLFLLFFNRPTW